MENRLFNTDKIVLIDLGNSACKLIIPIDIPDFYSLGDLSNKFVQDAVADRMCYDMGWFKATLEKISPLYIKEVEIVFPIKGMYLSLEENLKKFFKEKQNVDFRVVIGNIVNIPNMKEKGGIEKLREQIKNISKNLLGTN